MITRTQLREIHGQELPLHVLEQDYIQSLFLYELYESTGSLVFKGGTYLKHAFGLDRFSEDLDFTSYKPTDIIEELKESATRLSSYGIEAFIDKISQDELSINSRLRYRGPLYKGSERSMGSVDIEVSKRQDVLLEPDWVRLFFDYPELRVVNVLGLKKEEILAEKLRALNTREKGRDLYDVWFLLKQGVPVNKALYQKKMELMDSPMPLKIAISRPEWQQDLSVLLVNPPNYKDVKRYVISTLTESGIELR